MKKNNIMIGITIFIITIATFFYLINNNKNTNNRLFELTYDEILEKMDNKDDFILVISQSSCSHCATYKPKLNEIGKDYNLNIYYINIDLESNKNKKEFLNNFNLSGATPTTIFIKNGKEASLLNRLEGDVSSKKAIEKFKKMGFIEK